MSATYQGDKFQGAWAVCRWLWKDQTHEDGTLDCGWFILEVGEPVGDSRV